MVGRLVLVQVIGVRVPVRQPTHTKQSVKGTYVVGRTLT